MQGKSINTAGESRQKGSVWRGEMAWEKRKGKEGGKEERLATEICMRQRICLLLPPSSSTGAGSGTGEIPLSPLLVSENKWLSARIRTKHGQSAMIPICPFLRSNSLKRGAQHLGRKSVFFYSSFKSRVDPPVLCWYRYSTGTCAQRELHTPKSLDSKSLYRPL